MTTTVAPSVLVIVLVICPYVTVVHMKKTDLPCCSVCQATDIELFICKEKRSTDATCKAVIKGRPDEQCLLNTDRQALCLREEDDSSHEECTCPETTPTSNDAEKDTMSIGCNSGVKGEAVAGLCITTFLLGMVVSLILMMSGVCDRYLKKRHSRATSDVHDEKPTGSSFENQLASIGNPVYVDVTEKRQLPPIPEARAEYEALGPVTGNEDTYNALTPTTNSGKSFTLEHQDNSGDLAESSHEYHILRPTDKNNEVSVHILTGSDRNRDAAQNKATVSDNANEGHYFVLERQ